jgi:hypothetical protein
MNVLFPPIDGPVMIDKCGPQYGIGTAAEHPDGSPFALHAARANGTGCAASPLAVDGEWKTACFRDITRLSGRRM